MRTSAHGITILMRQFSFEWDYGAGRMTFTIPAMEKAEMNGIGHQKKVGYP
jgi:hypothetical protein